MIDGKEQATAGEIILIYPAMAFFEQGI